MTLEVRMPQMGESLAEGTVVKWYKQVGDPVRRDEPLFEISTDKVDTEVPSPSDGYLSEVLVREGETVPVNTVVCTLSDTKASGGTSGGGGDEKAGHVASSSTADAAPRVRAEAPSGAASSGIGSPGVGAAGFGAAGGAPAAAPASLERRLREKSSPLVPRLSPGHGIDISRLEGSGLSGRVTKEDLLKVIATSHDDRASEGHGTGTLEPMSAIRKSIAEHMTRSLRTSAHVSTFFEVDMTEIKSARETLRQKLKNVKLTYLPFVLRATAQTLRRFKLLNASTEGDNIRFHESVNLGIAVALEDGLIVPVIRDADKKTLIELTEDVRDLATRARTKQLLPEEVRGGTFTVTNPGVFGSLMGTPIINQPQVGILCVGAIQKRAVVLPDTDTIAARPMAYISLSFDHRVIDGAVADRFMARLKFLLEENQVESGGAP